MNPQIRRVAPLTVLTLVVVSAAWNQEKDSSQPERFQRSFAVKPGSTLRVENYKGTIHINGTNSNQVVVNVVKKFEGSSDADRARWMRETNVRFTNDSDRVEVKVEYPNQGWSCWIWCSESHDNYTAWVELEIQVPRQANLNLDGYKPDIKISSLQGDVRIESYKAPMSIESTTGAIHIDTYKDSVTIHNAVIRGDLQVKSYKADLVIEATSLGRSVDLASDKGSIVLRVPQNAGLDVDYEGSRRARFHSDFALVAQGSYSSDSVRGTVNQGGTRLRLRTDKGSVSLEKLSGSL